MELEDIYGNLSNKLQKVCPGFAYKLLTMEIFIDDQYCTKNITMQQIVKLMELYMTAVQVLQSASDRRFSYFYKKIQILMAKKHIMQKLYQVSVQTKFNNKKIDQLAKKQIQQKKNQHQAQIFYNQNQYDSQRIQQILKNAQNKLEKFHGRVNCDIKKQQKRLQQRLQLRKLKSENGSISNFNMSKNNNNRQNNNANLENTKDIRMEYFGQEIKPKRKGSVQKNIKSLRYIRD